MDDKEEKEETEGEATKEGKAKEKAPNADDSNKGILPETKTPSMIDGAVLAAEELRKQNDRKEELLKKEEELESKKILGGRSEAGQITPEKSEEDKQKAGAKEFFKGTQLEKDIEKL